MDRFRVADLVGLPLDSSRVVVTPRQGRGAIVLPRSLAEVLRELDVFRTLEEHVAALSRRRQLAPELAAPLRDDLQRLARAGVLVSIRQICENAALGAPRGPARLRAAAIVTCERPGLAAATLRRRIPAEREHGLAYAVIDDGRDRATSDTLQRDIAAVARELTTRIVVVSREDRHQFALRLAREAELRDLPPALLELCLVGEPRYNSVGAAYNSARLLAPGAALSCMDDDVTGRSSVPTEDADGRRRLRLTSKSDCTQIRFHATEEEAVASVPLAVRDGLSDHTSLLGLSLQEVLAAHTGAELDLDGCSPRLLAGVAGAWVAVTTNGLVGDSGQSSSAYYLLLEDENLAALEVDYARFRSTRAVHRAAPIPTLSEGGFFMAPSFCVDERTPLVPFLPNHRASDAAFAAQLRACLPGALLAHLPTVVEHRPVSPRRFPDQGPRPLREALAAAEALAWTTLSADLAPWLTAEERRQRYARHLRDLASLAPSSFLEYLRSHRLNDLARAVRDLSARLDARSGAEGWRQDVRAQLDAVPGILNRLDEALAPMDFEGDVVERRAALQLTMRQQADLVESWPAIVAAARALSERGEGLLPSPR